MPNRYLDEHGLDTLWKDIEKYHNTTQHETDGAIDGALLELTAKSKPATQQTTTGKNLCYTDTFTVPNNSSQSTIWSGNISGTFTISIEKSGVISVANPNAAYGIANVNGNNVYLDYATGAHTFTGTLTNLKIIGSEGYAKVVGTLGVQIELSSTATPYEPYTGGAPSPSPDYPQEIITVRGRNLIDESGIIANTAIANGVEQSSTASKTTGFISVAKGDFILSYAADAFVSTNSRGIAFYNADKSYHSYIIYTPSVSNQVKNFSVPIGVEFVRITLDNNMTNLQLTEGSTPQPYVPYGHVGLERRDSQGTLLDTTPIPLPSRGWVAGRPNGTADTLTLDGAGKVVWTEWMNEVVVDGDSNITLAGAVYDGEVASDRFVLMTSNLPVAGRYHRKLSSHFVSLNNDEIWTNPDNYIGKFVINASSSYAQIHMVFTHSTVGITSSDDSEVRTAKIKSWLSSNPVTVLYPLKTGVTEDCGYIDLPDTQDCVLSIPELDALGVRYTIGDGMEIARQWYQRAYAELGDAVVDLTDRVVELEQRVSGQ